MSAYVYIKSEPGLWTVGFYDPRGRWQPESDHTSSENAAARVARLNGASDAHEDLVEALRELVYLGEQYAGSAGAPALDRARAALAKAGVQS